MLVQLARHQEYEDHFRLKDPEYRGNRLKLKFTGRPWKARGLARDRLFDMLIEMLNGLSIFGYGLYGANDAVRRVMRGDSIFLIRPRDWHFGADHFSIP